MGDRNNTEARQAQLILKQNTFFKNEKLNQPASHLVRNFDCTHVCLQHFDFFRLIYIFFPILTAIGEPLFALPLHYSRCFT